MVDSNNGVWCRSCVKLACRATSVIKNILHFVVDHLLHNLLLLMDLCSEAGLLHGAGVTMNRFKKYVWLEWHLALSGIPTVEFTVSIQVQNVLHKVEKWGLALSVFSILLSVLTMMFYDVYCIINCKISNI